MPSGHTMQLQFDYTIPHLAPALLAEQQCQRLHHLVNGYQHFLGHDLANHLVSVQGLARLIREQLGNTPEETSLLLDHLAEVAMRADQQARRLAEIGKLLREPAWGPPLRLEEVVREAIAQVQASRVQTASASEFVLNLVEQSLLVSVSRPLLHQVLVELLRNASRASNADQKEPIVVEADQETNGIFLRVRDRGRGFSQEQVKRLGQIGNNGSGQGYFLILQALACWHGRLTIESEIAKGTTVSLFLPQRE